MATLEQLPRYESIKEDKPIKKYSADDLIMIDDCKDFLLTNLTISDMEKYIKELEAELLIRKISDERYFKYISSREQIKHDFKEKCNKELEQVKKALDESVKLARRERIRDTQSESEESESEPENIFEEEEIPKIVKKPKKQAPKPRGRPKKKS